MSVNDKSVNITFLLKKERNTIKLPPELANLLGLPSGLLDMGTYVGRIDLQYLKSIYIHCDQISTSENIYNGRPFTILNVLPIRDKAFGENRLDRIRQSITKKSSDWNVE